MSSNGLSGLSGISSDALQTRYEKALKQINKLIEINRQLKEGSTQFDQQSRRMNAQIINIRQVNSQLNQQYNIIQTRFMEMETNFHQLDGYCKKLEEQLEARNEYNQNLENNLSQNMLKFQDQMKHQSQKYNTLSKQAEQIKKAFQQCQVMLTTQRQKNAVLQKQNSEFKTENQKLQEQNLKFKDLTKLRNVEQLRIKLQHAQSCISKLMIECGQLKGKQIDFEVMQEKMRVQKYIGGSFNGLQLKNQAIKDLINQYKKKVKEAEEQKNHIYDKYKNLKLRTKRNQFEDVYKKKIQCLQKLTEKQHKQIARIIETYDTEINKIHKDNTRLRQDYKQLMNKMVEKDTALIEKENIINKMRLTTDQIIMQKGSLRKFSSNLEKNESKIDQFSKSQLSGAESITIQPIKKSQQFYQNFPRERHHITFHQSQKQTLKAEFATSRPPQLPKSPTNKIPITLQYSNREQNPSNFKFIQSVSIINGFNVNLSSHSRT